MPDLGQARLDACARKVLISAPGKGADVTVSRDIIGDPASCVFDAPLTQACGPLVKVFGWYDNEWGYTCRLVDLAALIGRQL